MRARIQKDERTSFQEAGPYNPAIDSRAMWPWSMALTIHLRNELTVGAMPVIESM